MMHLVRPRAFDIDTAAAACVALAAPILEIAATDSHSHDSGLLDAARVHRTMALAHVGRLNAALRVPGFPAAVAAEHPAALTALATVCLDSELKSVAAAFAPTAVEVTTVQPPP